MIVIVDRVDSEHFVKKIAWVSVYSLQGDWKVSEMESVRIGKCQNGKCQDWTVSIRTLSNSDTFQFWRKMHSDTFQFWRKMHSDTFQFWRKMHSDTFQFWHFCRVRPNLLFFSNKITIAPLLWEIQQNWPHFFRMISFFTEKQVKKRQFLPEKVKKSIST